MKNKLLFGLLLCMLMILPLASAGMFPLPVSGKVLVNGELAPGVPVTMYNANLDITINTMTDSSSHFMVDWANHPHGYSDKIIITALGMTRELHITDGNVYPNQDIGITDPNYVPQVVCLDGSLAAVREQCPPIDPPVIIRDIYICEDGTEVEIKNDCPEIEETSLAYKAVLCILGGLLVLALGLFSKYTWGKGFVGLCTYYKEKGDEARKAGNYALAEKHYVRAAKMLSTAMDKQKKNLYDKADAVAEER